MRCRSKLSAVLLVLAASATGTGTAHAISFGQIDHNLHPNVGVVVADWNPNSPGPEMTCSGTLIASNVMLTVAHCVDFIQSQGLDVQVSFDTAYDETSQAPGGLISGTGVVHPLFGVGTTSDAHDIAVILLDEAPGIAPAELPTAGLLDELNASHALDNATFTVVGYGGVRVDKSTGPHALLGIDGQRRYALQSLGSLQPYWLNLDANPSTGNGGSCFVDSGAPHFLGGVDSNLVVATTVDVAGWCRSHDKTYRMDTDSARQFLAHFVTLP